MRFRLLLLVIALPLWAHVGSPDIFFERDAGPYHLLVTIRPPQVIPGVAEVEIRSASKDVRQIRVVPLRITRSQQFAPVPELTRRSPEDPQFFTGSLWLMATGSWQVRVLVDGARGAAALSVPVPALATRVLGMDRAMSVMLALLGLFLCVGLVSIAAASVREAPLEPGERPDPSRIRKSRIVIVAAALLLAGTLYLGNRWWSSEDGVYRRLVFKPLQLKARIVGGQLELQLADPGWLSRRTDDLLPDHGHLMHLYVIRVPEMDRVFHLHPERGEDDWFTQRLPDMPAGRYALFGDIVHANGLPETATAGVDIPQTTGSPLTGDDAGSNAPALSKADYNRSVTALSGGGAMIWERGSAPLRARRPYQFRFRLEDAKGHPARRVELYMGMLGHAAFLSSDGSVFAHVHPSGSVPMPALQLTQPAQPMSWMDMNWDELPAEVSFPYGFPKPGAYRIFVQMKQDGKVHTGVFDAKVEN